MFAFVFALSAFAADPVQVRFTTTAGEFVVAVHPEWAPLGAARFLELVDSHAYDGAAFFRVVKGFVAQFGIPADPEIAQSWRKRRIQDDPRVVSNTQWTLSFANAGVGTRTIQVFVNLVDNKALDTHGFSPFAQVVAGTDVVASLYHGYGEGEPMGRGPSQEKIQSGGGPWLFENYPKLDLIRTVTRVVAVAAPVPPIPPTVEATLAAPTP